MNVNENSFNFCNNMGIYTNMEYLTLELPKPVKMTGTCQSVKESYNLFTEPELIVLYNFSHVFILLSFNMMVIIIRKIAHFLY